MFEKQELEAQIADLISENEEYQKSISQYAELINKKDIYIVELEKELNEYKKNPCMKLYRVLVRILKAPGNVIKLIKRVIRKVTRSLKDEA